MKLHAKSNIIILIFLGIIFSLSPFFITAANFSIRNMESSSEFSDEIKYDNLNLKISAISGKIHINNNWSAAKFAGICTGNGTFSEPYVIEDWVIDANNIESGILIENSDVYFIIENCTVYNSGYFPDAGIKLNNITNSQLINNDCSSNYNGIYLYNCKNTTISGNTANSNNEDGIYLYISDDNTVSGNTANNNNKDGICLAGSNNNTISENTANYNTNGIYLYDSDSNNVSGNNLIGNAVCIYEDEYSDFNIFENNDCEDRSYPPGYYIGPYLLSILIGITTFIGIVILIRYLNNRGFFLKREYRGLKYVPNKPLQQAPQGTINRTNFCKNCGTPLITKEDLFCSNCGQNLK